MSEHSPYLGIRNIPEIRKDTLKNGRHNLSSVFGLRSEHNGLSLSGIENWRVGWTLREKVREQLADLVGAEICMVERGLLTQRKRRILEVYTDYGRSLGGELPPSRCSDDGRGENEPFEWTKTDSVCELYEVEVAKHVSLTAINAISKPVCEEGITCEALGFLNQQAEGEGRRRVEGSGGGGRGEAGVGVNDETADEMEVGVDAMLLGQLHARKS